MLTCPNRLPRLVVIRLTAFFPQAEMQPSLAEAHATWQEPQTRLVNGPVL